MSELSIEEIYNDLVNLTENPVNINTAGREELEKLLFLNDIQILEIIEYRIKFGTILSPSELLSISGLNRENIQMMLLYIKFANDKNSRIDIQNKNYIKAEHSLMLRSTRIIEPKKGYLSGIYQGDQWKHYLRYRFRGKKFVKFGLTAEKDPGEEFFSSSQKYGFDFYSGFAEVNPGGLVNKIILGDFICQFGQGLNLWSGFSGGKSSYRTVDIKKRAAGLKSYSSSGESGFFRGAGISLKKYGMEFTAFISSDKIDSKTENMQDSSINSMEVIRTFYTSGLHRTETELQNRNITNETFFGANLNYRSNSFSVGLTFSEQIFDKTYLKQTKIYNVMEFNSERNNYSASMDFLILLRKITFFGEGSLSKNGGTAILGGVLFNPFSAIGFSLLYRNYSPSYYSSHSGAFSENTRTINEKGIYLGIEIQAFKQLKIKGYADNYSFPWLKYLVDTPSSGTEYLINLEYELEENIHIESRFRSEKKGKSFNNELPGSKISSYQLKQNFRNQLNINIPFHHFNLLLRSRLELSFYNEFDSDREKGWLLFQDLLYRPANKRTSLSLRYAIFNSESYNCRIYTYEHDLLYSFSTPSFYNKGFRFYINIKYKVSRLFDLWLKYAISKYPNKKTIGTAYEEIQGNKRSEIRVQLRGRI